MRIFYVADLLIAFSFVSLKLNPFEMALRLQYATKIARCWTDWEKREWQGWSLQYHTGTWTSLTKLNHHHQKKAAVKSLSRTQNKYALCLGQQTLWSGALLREGEWKVLAPLCTHWSAPCFYTAHNTCAGYSSSLSRWAPWFVPAAFLLCEDQPP